MADLIQLLPEHIANQIAAGEVIQRPASAVKELLENAVDAGATSITLVIQGAGKTLIQVIDNGCGMSETDARMCFERHATSKIKTIEDLFAIRTMGFRGEAMASIAAVAQVEMKTRKWGEELGTRILIEASVVKKQEPCQCAEGTAISVKNLFYNVPARRNFLKSDAAETSHIIEEFKRIALAHPTIAMSFVQNQAEIFHLKPGNLRQRIVAVFGNQYNERLVPVEEQTDIVKIFGFVGKPEYARKTRGEQYLFVNNRFIRNHYINHAVLRNYEELISPGSYPFFVLFLDVNPARIDINVHPAKQEIKFEEESIIYKFVRLAVKHALAKFSVTPTLDFDQEIYFSTLEQSNQPLSPPAQSRWSRDLSAISQRLPAIANRPAGSSVLQKQELLGEIAKNKISGNQSEQEPSETEAPTLFGKTNQENRKLYQLHNRYVVSPIKSGFILIDQQAAHERILYEETLKAFNQTQPGAQQQLFPQTVRLHADDAAILKQILPEIQALGFDIQEFGTNDFVIHGMPGDITIINPQEMIEKLLEAYKNNLSLYQLDKRERVARAVAQQTSIKAGQTLSEHEMQHLIDRLFACEQPYMAPDGRLTFITFDQQELERRFSKPSR